MTGSSGSDLRVAAALSALAGACGLSLELLWSRLLAIEVGGPLSAFVLVVASFTAGLSVGAALLGLLADRSPRPWRLFAHLMLGLAASAFATAVAAATGGLTLHTLRALDLAPGGVPFVFVEVAIAGVLTFTPACLLGGTVPVLLRVCERSPRPAVACGVLAAAGAAGSALGALGCVFLLLPALGLWRSIAACGGVALVGAAAASVAHRQAANPDTPARSPARGPQHPAERALLPPRRPMLFLLFALGVCLTASEVGWARVAFLTLGASAQTGGLLLAATVASLSAGNLLGARLARTSRSPATLTALLACGSALASAIGDPLLGRLPLLAIGSFGWVTSGGIVDTPLVESGLQLLLILLVVAVPCLFMGCAFPVGFRALLGTYIPGGTLGRAAGLAAAASSMGNLLGAPLFYLGLWANHGTRACLLLSAAFVAAVTVIVGPSPVARRAGVLVLAAVLAVASMSAWDVAILSSGPFLYGPLYLGAASEGQSLPEAIHQRGEVALAIEGPQALVTVRRAMNGALSMQVNGKTDASTTGDMKIQSLIAHLPLLMHSSSRGGVAGSVLVIGLGSGVTVGSALSHPVQRVDVVEISREVLEAASLFEEANRGALHDPRTRVILGDARTHMMFASGAVAPAYDVIASQPSNPWIAGEAILFTREFFELARQRLAPGGILCQWLQGYGLSPEDFRSVVSTFLQVFPHSSLWEESTAGGDYLLLGSDGPLAIDPRRLAETMGRMSIARDLSRIEMDGPADLLSLFVAEGARLGNLAAGAPIQTQDRLSLEHTAPPALHRDTLGAILEALEPIRMEPSSLAVGDVSLAAALARRSRAARKEREWAAGLGLLGPTLVWDAELLRAVSFLRAGMRRHAEAALRSVSLRRPADKPPRLLQAHLLMSAGRIDEASRELEEAAAMDPEDARTRLFLSRTHHAAGRLDQALAHNTIAIRLDPGLAEAYSDRCAMLLVEDDIPSAEAACLEAISLDDGLAEAHANMGVVRARRGRPEAAERSYRKALDLDPGLTDASFNLASLLERQGRGQEGLVALQALLQPPAPPNPDTLRLATRLAIQAGDPARARLYLEASVAIEPDNEEARELLGMLRDSSPGAGPEPRPRSREEEGTLLPR